MVKKLMRDNFKTRVFAPTDFLSEARLNGMSGEYVPFWMYDYDTYTTFTIFNITRCCGEKNFKKNLNIFIDKRVNI